MPTDKIKDVYDLISDKGYFADENEFRSYVNDPKKIKEVYSLIQDDGFFKDEKEFEGYFSDVKKKEPTTTSFTQSVSKELGLKPSTPFVQSTGQELPSKTAETTTQLDFTKPQPRLSAEEQQAQGMVTKQQKSEKALEFKEGVKQKLYDNNRYWLLQNKKEAQENGMTLKELQASRRKELANNYLDDSEQVEANAIVDHLDAKKSGDDKRAGEALKQYYEAKNKQRANFQSDMQNLQAEYDNIASRIEGGELDANLGLQTLSAIEKRQKNLEISQKAFLKPKEALNNFVQENATEIASVSKPTQTPYEQLEEYTNNLYAKVRQLKADLGYQDMGKGATLGGYAQDYAIRAEQDGGELLDELYAEELKLKTATKLLLLNRTPIQADETALGVLGKSFGNSLAPNLQKEQGTAVTIANNVKEIVEDAKIGEKVYEEQKKYAEESAKPYETYSAKWFAEPVGASLAIVPEFIIGSLVSEGVLGFTKLGKLLTLAEKYGKIKGLNTTAKYVNAINKNVAGKVADTIGKTFIKTQANGLKFGLTSEVVSKFFPSQEDELNFTTGYFGGVIGKGAESALSGAVKNMFKVFGNKGAEAAKKISELGGNMKLLKDAPKTVLGELGEEFGESLGQIYKQSSSWKEVGEKIKEQYGTLDKATEFVVLTGIMALGMGSGNSIGANLFTASKEAYNNLPREQRAIVDSILDEAKAADKQVEETVAEDIKKDIEKDLTPAELKEIETTTEETDGKGRTEEPISAGTDVLETGVGMAAEPGKEGAAGEDIQTETVPQAPLEEQKADIEKRRQEALDNQAGNIRVKTEIIEGVNDNNEPTRILIHTNKDGSRTVQFEGKFNGEKDWTRIGTEKVSADIPLEARGYANRTYGIQKPRVVDTIENPESLPANKINAKYDAELAALEKQQVPEVVSEKVTEVTAPAIEVTPTAEETVTAPKVSEALKDVESTAKALNIELEKGSVSLPSIQLNAGDNGPLKYAEAYHKAKADGSNPELVKAVEKLLGKPTAEAKTTTKPVAERIADYRAEEQAEYDAMADPNDEVARTEIYERYNKLITPLIAEQKAAEAAKVEPAKETAKPTKTERKAIAEAKIDDLAARAKEFLRNKNLPEGTKVSGVSQNKVIDILASTVKALVNSGIEISEAIKQVRELFEQDFDTSAIKDYEINQAIARDELTDVAKENGFSSYREAVFAVNKYVREVGKEDVITKDEIEKAKEAKDKEAEAPKKGYTSKKKKAQEGEKGTTVKETGRSKTYAEGRMPVSDAYNDVVNAQREYYETMNQKATLDQAEEYLAQYGDTEQGLLDAAYDMIKIFLNNPYLDARNAIAIELLADRMFAKALDFQKAGDSAKYNNFLQKSEDLRREAFKAHYKAGQFNSAVAVFSKSVNPDAFLSFIDGQVREGLEDFKKTKPNIYEKYEQEVKTFQSKVKDIKKAAAQQAVVSAPNSTTKVNIKLSDKLKARYEQGKTRQAEALKKLGKINFFGSSGLSNEAIEAVGELVLAQFEQGIYKAATIIERIIEITEGKLTEKNIKDVYDAYRVNYKSEKLTLTELEEVLRKEEIAEKEPATDINKALEKEREKLAKLKADYEQAVLDKADALVLRRAQQYAKDAEKKREKETKDELKAAEARRKERNRIKELRQKEEEAQADRILALRLQRAQQFVKDQEKKVKEQEDKAKKAATAKTAEGKRPTISDLIQRDLEADLTKEAIAKNLMTEGGLSEREANKLADIYYNKYRKILKEKIQAQLVKDLTPRKVKEIEAQMNALDGKPFGKTLGGMIANQVAAGALDSETLKAAFAAKYGIPAVSPIVAANIRALSAKVRAAKTTLGVNLANKNLLSYINSTVKTKKGSVIGVLYYTSILSGVSTAVVNTYGNVNNLINQSVENFVQSVIEAKQGNKGNLMSNTQGAAKIRLAVSNMVSSFTSFIDIMAHGGGESRYSTMKKGTFGSFESEDLILKKKDLKDLGLKKAFTSLLKLYKTAPAFFVRNLPASDEGFYMSNFNIEATRELRKKLYSEGLRGKELEKQVYEQVYGTDAIKAQALNEAIQELKRIGVDPNSRKLLANRIAKEIISKKLSATVQDAANELAKENTFRGQPRGATGYIAQRIPQLWLITPFVSTPFKMAEKMINYIPLYGAMRYYGLGLTDTLRKLGPVDEKFKRRGVEYAKREGELRNKQLAQVLTGHLLAMVFWGLSQIDWEDEDGKIVPFVDASAGYYGTSKSNREKLREALPEYTIRVGNLKFSYKTNPLLAMIALPFGVNKDSERSYEEMNFADWSLIYNFELASFIYESTPIKNLQQFFENIGKTFEVPTEDRTWEDVAKIPLKQAAALGANLAVDNIYKQIFDFYDPTKYVVQDNKEVLAKAFNMEKMGGLQTDYDRWGRDKKLYPGETFFPIQYMFKDKTDKEITDWEIKNDVKIPIINRKTLVLTDGKLKSEKSIENKKKELIKDYGITSEEYKLFEDALNADYKLLTPSEFQAYDKTVRSEIFNIIKTNFNNPTKEYIEFYKTYITSGVDKVKPISELSRVDARLLVDILFDIKKADYINKNFTKIEVK